MRIIDLALKDLSQIFRDKRSLLFLVAMPALPTKAAWKMMQPKTAAFRLGG
jgi:hypothetical protein